MLSDDDRDVMISVRGLGKEYTIAHAAQRPTTLAEATLARLRHPLSRFASETFWALNDVSFDVRRGDVVGVIGRNGAGKSTLFKVLSRITDPTTGHVDLYGRVGSLLEVGTGFSGELTGRENIYLNGTILGMRRASIAKRFDAIVDFAGVEQFLDTPVKRYSSGMYVRLAFAVAAHLDSEVMIIDEVLAVGDAEFQSKCLDKMHELSATGRTVLFVSHNMASIRSLCSRCLVLANGSVVADGDVDSAVKEYMAAGGNSEFTPSNGPLKRVSIRQENLSVVIEAEWNCAQPLALPNLGFVIYDVVGTPLTGSNPHLSGIDRLTFPARSGRVSGRITQPRLVDGTYFVSIWFGDGDQNFVEYQKCLQIEVAGMGGRYQLPVGVVGSTFPVCNWVIVPL